jgi:FkbH-like protein
MTDTGVRLVIWDLDETFWDGTLSEGGVRYRRDRHDLVVALARRGIMSAICSKNDFAPVRDLLAEHGIWDFFIFPSLDWTPKGERIRALIEDAQLRPDNVVFVDDNAANRAEAQSLLPALRTFDVDAIDGFLAHPDFRGKDDSGLTRLKQYKLLEAKQTERSRHAGDSAEFLRQSRIRVDLLTEIDLARAVELINRTNQLNFTKRRLPDDPAAAAAELAAEIGQFTARAGLVSVRDRYGDYGIVGFFLMTGLVALSVRLRHFCFSCRILGMGVEQYVYDLLGRPDLDIVGPVVSDPAAPVDWINPPGEDAAADDHGESLAEVRIRGGCELEALDYLFRHGARRVVGEYQLARGIYYIPAQHSLSLALAARGLTRREDAALRSLGLDAPFTTTRLFDRCPEPTLAIFSPALDVEQAVWRYRPTGLPVPLRFQPMLFPASDQYTRSTQAERREHARVTEILEREFEPVPPPFERELAEARRLILQSLPDDMLLVVALPNDRHNVGGRPVVHELQRRTNEDFAALGAGRENVAFVAIGDLIRDIGEVGDYYLHYQRVVYIRLYERIGDLWRGWLARRQ